MSLVPSVSFSNYRCLVQDCYRSFSRGSSLKQHMITQHKLPADSPLLAASVRRGQAIKQGNFDLLQDNNNNTAAGQQSGAGKDESGGGDAAGAMTGGTAGDGAAGMAALDESEGEGEEEDEEEEDEEEEDEEEEDNEDEEAEAKNSNENGDGEQPSKRIKIENGVVAQTGEGAGEGASADKGAAAVTESGVSG